MMVKGFGLPVDKVFEYSLILFGLLGLVIAVAVPLAFAVRWLANRREQ